MFCYRFPSLQSHEAAAWSNDKAFLGWAEGAGAIVIATELKVHSRSDCNSLALHGPAMLDDNIKTYGLTAVRLTIIVTGPISPLACSHTQSEALSSAVLALASSDPIFLVAATVSSCAFANRSCGQWQRAEHWSG